MGHRAYIAYEVSSGVYNLHYSHWGASELQLVNELSKDNPYGGDCSKPEFVDAIGKMIAEAAGEDEELQKNFQEETDIDKEPLLKSVSIHEIIKEIEDNNMIEALYMAKQEDETTKIHGYRPVKIPETNQLLLLSHRPVRDTSLKNYYSGMVEMCKEITEEANISTSEIFYEKIMEEISTGLSKHVLAASPGVKIEDYEKRPEVFFNFSGRHRIFDEMRISQLTNVCPWQKEPNQKGVENNIIEVKPPKTMKSIENVNVDIDELEDKPRVQLPIGQSGLTIRGNKFDTIDFPRELLDLYQKYAKQTQNSSDAVYQCDNCGFITQSSRVGDYKAYKCNNCNKELSRQSTYTTLFNNFTGDVEDILEIKPENVPNSNKHLKKIKSNISKTITQNEFISQAEEIIAKYEQVFGKIETKENKNKLKS